MDIQVINSYITIVKPYYNIIIILSYTWITGISLLSLQWNLEISIKDFWIKDMRCMVKCTPIK